MDGYLKIKTKIDNKDVDKGITELENKIKKLQEDNSRSSQEQTSLQKEIDKYEQMCQEADKYKQKIKELELEKEKILKQNPTLAVSVDTPQYANIKTQIAEIQTKYAQATNEIDKQAPKIDRVYSKLSQVKAKQEENNQKISEYKQKIEQINLNKVQNSLNTVGKNIQNQISGLGKMAMAVVGIRTAWGAVRSAISMVSQYNEQVSADFEYMRYCIASMLIPVVQGLIKLLYTVLSYVNAIASAWFGINLFGNASVKNFKKMQSSAGKTAKSAKEISKSLQGFDEMNVLQDNSSNSSEGGVTTPSMDLSGIQGEVPSWLKWIIDNKDLILAVLAGIAGGIASLKLLEFLANLGLIKNKLLGIKAIGIGIVIAGIVLLIQDVIKMIKDPSWSNFGKILVDIGIILTGIALITGSWMVAIVALVAVIAGLCIQLFSQQGAILSVEDAQKNLEEATKNLEEANRSYADSVDKAENTLEKLKEAEAKAGITGEELYKQVQQGTLDYKNMTDEQKAVYKAYLDNETAQKNLKEATDKLADAKKKEKIASWENKLATMAEAGQYDEYKKSVVEAFKNGELSAEEARDLIGKSMSGMSRDSQKTFMEDLPSDIKDGLDPKNYETAGQRIGKWFEELWRNITRIFTNIGQKIGEAVSGAFKSAVNAVLSTIERILNTPIRAVNKLIGVINMVPGINLGKLSTFNLPRLAKGGVISQPTQAIIGEAGKEAVVPLENNLEWLDILADKLSSKIGNNGGSYIIQMDSRTIQRGIAKRQQELAFATNGR